MPSRAWASEWSRSPPGCCPRSAVETLFSDIGALLRDPATYALAVAAVVALLTYSTALQRGSVTQATAPLVVGETVVPAIVGVVMLGDVPREGWEWVAVVGFALAVGGALALAGHGEVAEPDAVSGTDPVGPHGAPRRRDAR